MVPNMFTIDKQKNKRGHFIRVHFIANLVVSRPLPSRGRCQDGFDVKPMWRDGKARLGDLDDEETIRGKGGHVMTVPDQVNNVPPLFKK